MGAFTDTAAVPKFAVQSGRESKKGPADLPRLAYGPRCGGERFTNTRKWTVAGAPEEAERALNETGCGTEATVST